MMPQRYRVVLRFGVPAAVIAVLAAVGVNAVLPSSGADRGVRAERGLRAELDGLAPSPSPSAGSASPAPSPTATPAATPTDGSPSAVPTPEAPRPPATAEPRRTPSPVKCGATGPDTDDGIWGQVVDGAGKPVPDLVIDHAACVGPELRRGVNLTDENGRFVLPCSTAGPGYSPWLVASPFRLHSGRRTTGADVGFAWVNGYLGKVPCGSTHRVVVPAAGTVEARVVDATGRTVEEDFRFAMFLGDSEGGEELVGVTAVDGVVRFNGLAAGRYYLYSSDDPGNPDAEMRAGFTIETGQTTRVTIRAAGGGAPTPLPTPSPTPSATPATSA